MSRKLHNILLTGGAGFIGSNFVHLLAGKAEFTGNVINLDKLTYAGDLKNLDHLPDIFRKRYHFVEGDICDVKLVSEIFQQYDIDTVVHMAAESHVDRSITSSIDFIQTNIVGTHNLLQVARTAWPKRQDVLFHHVSTDEVYGALGETGQFSEDTKYDPRSPYSASKASSDHLVRAFHHTYGLPVTISNCSNNYGPRQNAEKLIPRMISNMHRNEKLPVYGEGLNIRDWIHVDDHNEALWQILKAGAVGNTYNIGAENEVRNIEIVKSLCKIFAQKTSRKEEDVLKLITFVEDRLGHDYRYSVNASKLSRELGWKAKIPFGRGIEETVNWYLGRV